MTVKPSHNGPHDEQEQDDDEEEEQNTEAPPTWAVHNPPRPPRETLIPHSGGDGGNESPIRHRTHKAHESSTHVVVVKDTPSDREMDKDAPIASQTVDSRVVVQVVIDKVGHGVAPDQPRLVPEPSVAAVAFATVESNELQEANVKTVALSEWQWKHRDSLELGLVSVAVLVVAVVVIAIARRQQRAYDRQQQQQQQQTAEPASLDLENGGVRFDTSSIRLTRDDDDIGTPESVREGVV